MKNITLDDLAFYAGANKDKKFNLECADSCLVADFTKEWMDGYYRTCKNKEVPKLFGDFCKYCVETQNQKIFTGIQLRKAIYLLEEFGNILDAYEATQNV